MNELINILPPPSRYGFDSDAWVKFEAEEKLRVPQDFKELISIYGGGQIDGFLWILNPFSVNRNLSFEKSKYFQEAYASMQQEFPSDYFRPAYPEQGSFLPWAVTDNGETFVWLVDGEPDSWKVAIHSSDQGEEESYSCGCVEFILNILRRDISSRILPSQFPPANLGKHVFKATD
ncbi:SMI1/KNR4 family protein [Pseudomonas cichorii]|uniref:SMI1/KNR4 family protein n=1 Tax=Pseudomonas cichorii TaxID=36746 RepID=UPI001C892C12|nr:SMI1/KNR4 family protein [Pseudomonas cichorii]MBX8516834.1 SMI1/KNR4 family protein [Pseudomonas cichorii]